MHTLLHEAAQQGNLEAVKRLLDEEKISVDCQNNSGNTPLYLAVRNCHKDVVEVLLAHGANVNLQDRHYNTALHYAIRTRDLTIATLLLNNGANPNIQDNCLNTPLHYAALKCSPDIVKLLLNSGSNPNIQDKWLNTPLHHAAFYCNMDIIKLLLNSGSNPNIQDKWLNIPFHYVASKCNPDIIKLLLNSGSNLNLLNHTRNTPFMLAYNMFVTNQAQNKEVMELLVAEMVKLDHSGIKISESNLEGFNVNKQLISESDLLKELEQQCHKEIEEMKSIRVGKNNLSFFDIFVLQKDINMLARCANNSDIVKFQNKFSMYSSFIEKSIGDGQARAKLLQGAAESMDEIFESNQDTNQENQTSWSHLPPEVRVMILENLSNNDLTKLQHTDVAEAGEAGAEVEDEVGGAYAIYEEE
ncbi:ankyrin repeat domain-containing protein [Orientia tsutsugamushi]|uniref:ankyrin repeat domain-containing protein n=1 Tax=Orientia tsutsugamushi TaxID=784 RepID=UPI000D5A6266|nr:ankyrin repeat-containing protein 09 [Orientia tsutsugamushi]SPR11856.1 ankyrin repeat-containing protein 09 [Orientia tsutsugamushi]SPR14096.1 ankyrin repeat-containing protein 09 [Orientia tsutsugamushi]